jgi:hypothetical protein
LGILYAWNDRTTPCQILNFVERPLLRIELLSDRRHALQPSDNIAFRLITADLTGKEASESTHWIRVRISPIMSDGENFPDALGSVIRPYQFPGQCLAGLPNLLHREFEGWKL